VGGPRRGVDRLPIRRLGDLPLSGILPADIRYLRENFWIVDDPSLLATPCGLDWTTGDGTS
jgi:hypothetical protein